MVNVFMISSDERIAGLVEFFQPFFKSKIRCAADFDNGLKEVFENRPTIVFIQSEIDTVSAETVSGHIKSLLGTVSPRIVFMGDPESDALKDASCCDDWIHISDSPQQLRQDFGDLIARCFPKDWQDIHKKMEKSASASTKTSKKARFFGNKRPDEPVLLQTEADCSVFGLNGAVEEISGREETDDSRIDDSESHPDTDDGQKSPVYQNLYEHPLLKVAPFTPKRRSSRPLFIALFLLAMAGGSYFWTLPSSGIQSSAATSVSSSENLAVVPPERTTGSIKGLPTFVRKEWRDLPYTSQHPGWERYLSPEMEFRVFREQSKIKALQGISRQKEGISEGFLTEILEQFNIKGPLPEGKEEADNGFLVKNIVFPGAAELVTYREQDSSKMKAFVLEFS